MRFEQIMKYTIHLLVVDHISLAVGSFCTQQKMPKCAWQT